MQISVSGNLFIPYECKSKVLPEFVMQFKKSIQEEAGNLILSTAISINLINFCFQHSVIQQSYNLPLPHLRQFTSIRIVLEISYRPRPSLSLLKSLLEQKFCVC